VKKKILIATSICKTYTHPKTGIKTEVLRGINLELEEGESLAIIGRSG